jgi:Alpha/beta hydrolase of unknown function (DUF900)
MKTIMEFSRFVLALRIGALLLFMRIDFASAQQTQSSPPLDTQAIIQAIISTPAQPASEAPKFGNFYSAQFGDKWPPLPADVLNLPFWDLGQGFFLLDDTNVDYNTLQNKTAEEASRSVRGPEMMVNTARSVKGSVTMDSPPSPPGGGGGGGGGGPLTPDYTYSTNDLWLEILEPGANAYNTDTNSATVLLHGTVPDVAYLLFSATNLNAATTGTVWTAWAIEQNLIGAENTNVTPTTVSMVGRPMLYLRALAYTLDDDGDGLPSWWETRYSTAAFPLNPTNADTGNTGIPDGYKMDSAGDGWNNLQKYQMGIPPNVWVTPPTPTGLSVVTTNSGTNANLSWNASPGPVLSYDIYKDGSFLTNVSASQTSFTDTSYQPGDTYQFQADFSGGDSLASPNADPQINPGSVVNAKFVRGPFGRWQLAFSAIPASIQSIQISWGLWDYFYDYGGLNGVTQTISVSNLANGCYVIPDDVITNELGGFVSVQGIGSDGLPGPLVQAGILPQDAPYWMDGRQHLQDNLAFLIRAAGETQPYTVIDSDMSSAVLPLNTNFVQVSFIHPSVAEKYFTGNFIPFIALENVFPLTLNYALAQWLYSTNPAPSWSWQPDFSPTPPSALTPNSTYQSGPYWIAQDVTNIADFGAWQPTNGSVSMNSGIHNVFGSLEQEALCTGDGLDPLTGFSYGPEVEQLPPGGSVRFSNPVSLVAFSSQFPAPTIQTVDYYFAPINTPGTSLVGGTTPVQAAPSPLHTNFDVHAPSPLIIGAVGQPMVIGGWARQTINGNTNKYAFLGQYFETNAYKIDTNGVVTTNTTGILSPYGEFFPTEPGPTALITMSDLVTGHRGTGVVYVIKLQLDVNHDGTMDQTFAGPDNTSADRPFRFWVNSDCDKSSTPGYLTDPGHDVDSPQTPDYADPYIQSERDLEDFARLWIVGLPPLTNYIVSLEWNSVSGAPAINLFRSAETNGGTGYLTDTNVAAAQIFQDFYTNGPGAEYLSIRPNFGQAFGHGYFSDGGPKYFLFEGAGIGEGELRLTISMDGTNIASTSAFMDLHNVEDFYERAQATNVTSGLPPSALISQYQVLGTTSGLAEESKQVILHVHGINISEFQWRVERDTIFKRLYWSGYQGRFASFRWPCAYLPFVNTFNPFNYNLGEFYAYKSAAALKNYLSYLRNRPDLEGYSLDILAHSQGNVITSESIRQGAPFDNYILTQGSVPAHCYDTNAPFLQKLLIADTNTPTPFYTTNGGYHGYFANLSGGRLIDFFNTNDFALVSGTYFGHQANWEADQETQKPENFIYRGGPEYSYYPSSGRSFATIISDRELTDTHEIMAMVARSRSRAVGAQPGLGGPIGNSVDLKVSFGFDVSRDEHSAQITRPIQTVWEYYNRVMVEFGLQPTLQP